jgi:hypothetical protein
MKKMVTIAFLTAILLMMFVPMVLAAEETGAGPADALPERVGFAVALA